MKRFTKPFLKRLLSSWHFKVFLCNLAVLLVLSSFNYWIEVGAIPNNDDSILYIVHAFALKNSLLRYLVFPSIDMMQYAGIPVLGVGPLVPFIPLTLVALLTGEVFAYKLLTILMLAAAGGAMSYYVYSLAHSRIASFVAGAIYVWNPPMFITAVIAGHLDLTWSYMLIPLVFLTTSRALSRTSSLNLGIAGALFGLLLFGEAQTLLLVGPFYLIYALLIGVILPSVRASSDPQTLVALLAKKLGTLAIIVLLGFALAAIRLLPLIYETTYLYSDVSASGVILQLMQYSSPSVFHALLMITSGYESLSSPFMTVVPILLALIVTGLFLAAIIFMQSFRSDSTVVCFFLCILAGFFSAGPLAPQFFQPFMWLFYHVPFYGEVRTPGRFDIMVAFFWSILIGIAAKNIYGHFSGTASRASPASMSKGIFGSREKSDSPRNRSDWDHTRIRVVGSLFIILMVSTAPLLAPSFTTYSFSPQLAGAYQTIMEQQGDFRFVGFPIATYYPREVYGMLTNPDCYATILTGKGNLFGDGSGASKYLVDFLYYYLNSLVSSNVSCSIGKLLGLYNVKWVIVHRPMLQSNASGSLLSDPTLKVIYSSPDNSEIVLENIEQPYPLVYEASSILLLGGADSLPALVSLDQFDLNSTPRWAFIPAYQLGSFSITEDFISKLDAVGFRECDLTSVFALDHGTPAAGLLSSTGAANNGWRRMDFGGLLGRFIPRNFTGIGEDLDRSSSSMTGSYISAAGNADLSFNMNIENGGEYELWARTWFSKNVGNISLTIDESTPMVRQMAIPSDAWQFGWHWTNCGTYNFSLGVHSLIIRNTGGTSSLDSLMVAPRGSLGNFTDYFASLLERHQVSSIYVLDAHTSFGSVDDSWSPSIAWRGNTSTGRCLSTAIDGADASARILVPVQGNYTIAIRLLQRELRGNMTIYLDGLKLLDFRPQGDEGWVTRIVSVSSSVSAGYHNLTMANSGVSGNDVDKIIMTQASNGGNLTSFFAREPSGEVVALKELSPGLYNASIELKKPSLVVMNAAFHPSWHASGNTSEYVAVPTNYFVNGFYINNAGRLALIISFGQTPPRILGFMLTSFASIVLVVMVAYGKFALRKNVRKRSTGTTRR
ncbi:MAG: hypothetical protein WED04_12245 [Promethearchaeati archaeon SRVP18_Atabeyarchaeia-1]